MQKRKSVFLLILLLLLFLGLVCSLPLSKAVQIGGDEGFELAKATLCQKGFKLYTEVWNDQPPLHTFLITKILDHLTPSVAGPRLLTVGFSVLLLTSFFFICQKYFGVWVAVVGTGMLLAAPIFLEIGVSCMLEVPAMAPALAMVWVLSRSNGTKLITWREVLAGALLAISLQIKFINLVLVPLMGTVLWLNMGNNIRRFVIKVCIIGLTTTIFFLGINRMVDGQGFVVQFKQAWESHFAQAKSYEYGNAEDRPFDWKIPAKNWDLCVLALVGAVVCLKRRKIEKTAIIPVVWLGVNLLVFAAHKPWWSYYYLHLDVPLCFCAAIGLVFLWQKAIESKRKGILVGLGIYTAILAVWMGARVTLEVLGIQHCPRIYTCLFLEDIARYKPYTEYLYTEELVYSFYSGIPMPPRLAVVPLKRLWSGDLTNDKIREEMWRVKPGMILLKNQNMDIPFSGLISKDYKLVYNDMHFNLYVSKEILLKAKRMRR